MAIGSAAIHRLPPPERERICFAEMVVDQYLTMLELRSKYLLRSCEYCRSNNFSRTKKECASCGAPTE